MPNEENPAVQEEEVQVGAVGGEALMEGIMMRGPKGAAISLRLADGSIETGMKKTTLPSQKCKILGWPLIRGPVSFIYSMVFGYKCLMESAERSTEGLLESGEVEAESKIDKWIEAHFGPKMMAVVGGIAMVLGVALALVLFIWAPTALTRWLVPESLSRFYAIISGLMRVLLFVLYMLLVSQMSDIRRVFQYHGAEHKAIFCYEKGLPLTVENVRAQSRFHPRCGTSFLFVMLLLSIVLTSTINLIWPQLATINWAQITIKILQFPVIMALGYEFIRFAGRHLSNPIVRVLSSPGLAMQRITTKEPDDDIIEVGIEALKAALGRPYEAKIPAKGEAQGDDPASDADRAAEPAPEQ